MCEPPWTSHRQRDWDRWMSVACAYAPSLPDGLIPLIPRIYDARGDRRALAALRMEWIANG